MDSLRAMEGRQGKDRLAKQEGERPADDPPGTTGREDRRPLAKIGMASKQKCKAARRQPWAAQESRVCRDSNSSDAEDAQDSSSSDSNSGEDELQFIGGATTDDVRPHRSKLPSARKELHVSVDANVPLMECLR